MGGIARIGQLQLLQPFLTLFAAALLLHEQVSWKELLAAVVVIICVLRQIQISKPDKARVLIAMQYGNENYIFSGDQ